MRTGWVCLSLILMAAGPQPVNRDKLRQLARMPAAGFEWNVVFDDQMQIALPGDPEMWMARVKAIRASLRGNTTDAGRHFQLGELDELLAREELAKAGKEWRLHSWGSPPHDPARHLAAAQEYERLARDAYARSADLYRTQLEQRPNDRNSMFERGRALVGAGAYGEADRLLRALAYESPHDWRAWAALGRCAERTYEESLKQVHKREDKYNTIDRAAWNLAGRQPAAALRAEAQSLWDEARAYYDRAVRCAPDRPQPYLYRARFGLARALRMEGARAPSLSDTVHHVARHAPQVLDDVRAALDRDPDNVRLLAGWVVLNGWSPSEMSAALQRLESIAGNSDGARAAAAWEGLALLEWLSRPDLAQLIARLRQAVQLQPALVGTWEMLVACYRDAQRFEEAAAAGVEIVRQADSPRHRLELARTFYSLQQFDRADEQVQAALLLEPLDPEANLFQAVLLMKNSRDPSALALASRYLDQAREPGNDAPSIEDQHALALLRAIHAGLVGDVRRAQREWREAHQQRIEPQWDDDVQRALRSFR